MRVRDATFEWGSRTYIMAVVNASEDSFSGDGASAARDAVEHACGQLKAGADIVDIGGESTRPGHVPVNETQELQRVIPVIEGVRARHPDAVLSVDTYKPNVARAAKEAGADIVNCVWGAPQSLLELCVQHDMPLIVMHNAREPEYHGDVVTAVARSLRELAEAAVAAGLARERVIVDPGIGFAKTPDENIALLGGLDRIRALGFPTLLGTSRKSTLGKLSGRDRPSDRVFATCATTALASVAQIDIVRVHDVAANRDVARVTDAVVRGWRPPAWTR